MRQEVRAEIQRKIEASFEKAREVAAPALKIVDERTLSNKAAPLIEECLKSLARAAGANAARNAPMPPRLAEMNSSRLPRSREFEGMVGRYDKMT
jgi:hypothetical protein